MLCHIQPYLDILFLKVTAQIWKNSLEEQPSVHYASGVGDFK